MLAIFDIPVLSDYCGVDSRLFIKLRLISPMTSCPPRFFWLFGTAFFPNPSGDGGCDEFCEELRG
jgi:hypothetical protein